KLIDISKKLGAPLLATNDCHYTHREDSASHDALLCVQTGCTISDPNRLKFEGHEHYLKTAEEMRWLFREQPTSCDNSLWIAERSKVDIQFNVPVLPNFPIPDGFKDDHAYLEHLTWIGAKQRWGEKLAPEVVERVAYELLTIKTMGFSSYFLIVWDLVRYAHEKSIRVGPGRGSAAGCAVAYSLKITDLDPIKYDLLFERFLNPGRRSMPDIDMDFDSRYRDEMIRYASEKYGRDHVAQIITFGTIKARNAVRDAARVLGFPYGLGDKIAKSMPPVVMGRDTPLKYCFEEDEQHVDGYRAAAELRALYESDPDVKTVVDTARGLEGLKRSVGIHAAAVVITKEKLTEYLPIQRKAESGQDADLAPIVTQYEMHAVEELGLLKMDILGLRNLDVITDTNKMIQELNNPSFDIDTAPFDDQKTFELLRRGDTIGVFQLESTNIRALVRSMVPTTIDDIAAIVALYRPGPMGANMHNDYADFKNGRKTPKIFHPDAQDLLGDTQGLMIYQESMMRVAQKFAGYSLEEADDLRKACGKKNRADMKKQRASFEQGCVSRGYGQELAETLFDSIENFADYAFGKSHAYGYAFIAYQTAYLKANYPLEYLSCLLTSVKASYDRAAIFLADARASNITVKTPDINSSGVDFVPVVEGDTRVISFGLSAIRNVGEVVVGQIVEYRRANGSFKSFYDFVDRAPIATLNKRTVESLIKAGAFDSLGHPRKGLLLVFESIIENTLSRRRERDQGVMSLFDQGADSQSGFSEQIEIPNLNFEKSEQLKIEREMLGLYVSDHPLRGVEGQLRRKVECSLADLDEKNDGSYLTLGGVITVVNRKFTRKGDQMAVLTIEDLQGSVEVNIFPKTFSSYGHLIEEDTIITVRGRLDKRDDSRISFNAQELKVVEPMRATDMSLHIELAGRSLSQEDIVNLQELLKDHGGQTPVQLHMPGGKSLRLAPEFNVDIDRAIGALRASYGNSVYIG
ncbi:MAG: DNA polymerase III subunit alpha, partial [Actinobacteria bacterium]|nr:DNA polymerase III subunit alpha [Actinomycetota bacterium]